MSNNLLNRKYPCMPMCLFSRYLLITLKRIMLATILDKIFTNKQNNNNNKSTYKLTPN